MGNAMSEISNLSAEDWIDQIPYPSLLLGADSRVLHANRTLCRRFGTTPEECLGREALAFLRGDGRGGLDGDLARWIAGDVYSVRVEVDLADRPEDFFALPTRVALADRVAIHLVLVPANLLPVATRSNAPRDATAESELPGRSRAVETSAGGGTRERDMDLALARLTPRETEIAKRIAAGDRVGLICGDLGISVNTVRNHLKSIFRKLRIRSQSELVRRLRKPPPPSHAAAR
jgi:DNA-binding CsgD family transcriptional regulator